MQYSRLTIQQKTGLRQQFIQHWRWGFLPFLAVLNLCLLIWVLLWPSTAQAFERSTPEQAKALVKRAVEYYMEHGKQKSFAVFNDPKGPFVKGDLYLFAFNLNGDGVQLVHGNNPRMLGKNVLDMRDSDGKFMIRAFIEIGNSKEGAGWVDYKWPNPFTKTMEIKSSYVERVGDILIGCGALRQINEKTP